MRTISKIICGIFAACFLFILVNLVIWAIQYWWTKNYSEYLNNKNRKDTIEEVYILKPKTWLSVFYELEPAIVENTNDSNENLQEEKNIEVVEDEVENTDLENLSWDNQEVDDNVTSHNPYDPDYEDEFNSFFWVDSEETWDIIPVQEIEDLEPAGFVADENAQD